MNGQIENEKFNISMSVRNFVEFIMRSGDIDNRITGSMSKEAMTEGNKMHRKIQGNMGINYQPEVPLKISIEYKDYSICLEGRADGVITDSEVVVIDEIKTTYDDVMKLSEPIKVHKAQAMCYAYMYLRKNQLDKIGVQMTYCNLDTEEIKRFKDIYTSEELKIWFKNLIEQYLKWTNYIAQERTKKIESIQNLEFPFKYRKGQRNIVVSVYKTIMNKNNLYIQAPTGVGKTISTIYPSVRSVGEGITEKIFYLTAKTITRTVAEEAFNVLRQEGLHFKTITLTAKEKICPLEETNCNPDKCTRAKGHFDRVNEAIYDLITNEHSVTREVVENYAEKYNVCPFEMGLDVSNFMDGVICDYNYVFDPYAKLKRYFADGVEGNYVFLVDEAHNLVERAREMYSAVIVKEEFLACKKIVKDRSKGMVKWLDKCNGEMLALKRECVGTSDTESKYTYTLIEDIDLLVTAMLRLQTVMEKFLDNNKEFEKRDEVLDLYFKVRNFLDVYELVDGNYVMYSDFGEEDEFFVKLFCVNPSGNIKQCMNTGISTIFFSATLLPVNYYKELLSGDIDEPAIYIASPFDANKRLICVASDVSSKYTRRNMNEYSKILRIIASVISQCKGNYMVFFPSYRLMNEIYHLAEEIGITEKYEIFCQTSNMTEIEREEFLMKFDEEREDTLLGFCVLGGIFSEGIDLKNERLIGSIIVGTGLPMVCSEREILKNYYDGHNRNGFDYAYKYSGMNKVLQAAGRVIRTDNDFGVISLLDERFLWRDYQQLFPREWSDYKVINVENVEKVVGYFWKKV
jgi:Rad3-related DNA helicase